MSDPLVSLIFPLLPYSDIPTEADAEAIAAAIRAQYRVIPDDLVTQETRMRSHLGGCEHRFVVHHNPNDPCP